MPQRGCADAELELRNARDLQIVGNVGLRRQLGKLHDPYAERYGVRDRRLLSSVVSPGRIVVAQNDDVATDKELGCAIGKTVSGAAEGQDEQAGI